MPETSRLVGAGGAAAVAAVAFLGGALPLLVRWSDRRLHAALALSTGVFLGAVFLHVLPELSEAAAGGLAPHALWAFVLVGVLAVYFAETLFLHAHHDREHPDQHHRAVGWAALFGLSVHSLTAGIGLAFASRTPELAAPLIAATIGHKGFEAFSLTSVFQLAKLSRRAILLLAALFALMTPLGYAAGDLLAGTLSGAGVAIAVALAAGSFLYVSLCELLPEVFHHREDGAWKVALLLAGIGVMAWFGGGHGPAG